jgi:hypothetical protein
MQACICLRKPGRKKLDANLNKNQPLPSHDRKRQFMASEGPVFDLMSYASAGNSWLKTTGHGGAKWVTK